MSADRRRRCVCRTGSSIRSAVGAEGVARFTGREPRVTLDGVRMSTKHMYFSSRKAERELNYRHRDPAEAIREAIDWFKRHEYF